MKSDLGISNKPLTWFLCLGVVGYALYGIGIDIQYYGDDLQFYFGSRPQPLLAYFFHQNPYSAHVYRPLEAVFLAAVQQSFHLDTIPIHLVQISLHIVLACLVLAWMWNQGFAREQSLLAAFYLLISQASTHAVLSNDTFSQVLGTLAGYLSLYCLWTWLTSKKKQSSCSDHRFYWVSLAFFGVSLYAKETSLSFFLIIIALLIVDRERTTSESWTFHSFALRGAPFAIVLVSYLSLRVYLGLLGMQFSKGGYEFAVGRNVLFNLALLFFQAFLPYSSVNTFLMVQQKAYVDLFLVVAGALVVVVGVAYGHWRLKMFTFSFSFCLLAVVSLFPAILLTHISELYLYNALPAIAILFGAGVGYLLTDKLQVRKITIALSIGLLLVHGAAVQSKARMMKANGNRAIVLFKEIMPFVALVPPNGRLLLVNPASQRLRYSVFLLPGFHVIDKGLHYLYQLTGRSDFFVEVIDKFELQRRALDQTVVLTLNAAGSVILFDTKSEN